MKKLFAIFLFICLILPFTASYTWLQIRMVQVRKEVKERILAGLDKSSLVLLQFSQAEAGTVLQWKHSREFSFRDQLYDIVSVEQKGDSLLFWCWEDHKEQELNNHLEDLVSQAAGNSPSNKENQKRLNSIFKTFFISSEGSGTLQSFQELTGATIEYLSFYTSLNIPPLAPPPKTT